MEVINRLILNFILGHVNMKRAFLKETSERTRLKMKRMNKKAGTPIDITILVIMALVLSVSTLFVFYIHSGKVTSNIKDIGFLDSVYLKENKISFYIQDMAEKSVANGKDAGSFLINFKNELNKHKINNSYVIEELAQLEKLNEQNVVFQDGKLILLVSINIKQDFENRFIVNYNFNKKFEIVY